MPKLGLISLGCAKNLVDSEHMLSLMRDAGWEITEDMSEADVGVVNTCGFIEAAKTEAIETILETAQYKQTGNMKGLVVTGCLVQRYADEMRAELPEIDVFIGSEFYYNKLFGESEEYEKNLSAVRARGPKVVVFTLGDKGSVVAWEDGWSFAPGFKVPVVDTLGAGDVYHGGYIFAMMQGKRPDECARFANAVAAIKCTGIGGRAGTPNLEMVEQFLETGTFDRSLIEEKTKLYANFGV